MSAGILFRLLSRIGSLFSRLHEPQVVGGRAASSRKRCYSCSSSGRLSRILWREGLWCLDILGLLPSDCDDVVSVLFLLFAEFLGRPRSYANGLRWYHLIELPKTDKVGPAPVPSSEMGKWRHREETSLPSTSCSGAPTASLVNKPD